MTICLGLVDHNSVEQTLSADGLDERALNSRKPLPEHVAELLCALNHILLTHDLKRANRNRAAEWVTTVGRTMGTGFDCEHDVLAAQYARDRVHATGDGLAKQDKVGLNSAPLVAQQLTRAGNASLDLVANQKHIVLIAEGARLLQIVRVGDDDTGLTLDGLNEEGSKVGASGLEGLAQGDLIVVRDGLFSSWNCASDTGQIRTVVLP